MGQTEPTTKDEIRDELVRRIEDCQVVVGEIESNPAWKILMKDIQMERVRLDDNWQNFSDKDKFEQARIIKLSIMHLINVVEKYKYDLESCQKELATLDDPEGTIVKDYDEE